MRDFSAVGVQAIGNWAYQYILTTPLFKTENVNFFRSKIPDPFHQLTCNTFRLLSRPYPICLTLPCSVSLKLKILIAGETYNFLVGKSTLSYIPMTWFSRMSTVHRYLKGRNKSTQIESVIYGHKLKTGIPEFFKASLISFLMSDISY